MRFPNQIVSINYNDSASSIVNIDPYAFSSCPIQQRKQILTLLSGISQCVVRMWVYKCLSCYSRHPILPLSMKLTCKSPNNTTYIKSTIVERIINDRTKLFQIPTDPIPIHYDWSSSKQRFLELSHPIHKQTHGFSSFNWILLGKQPCLFRLGLPPLHNFNIRCAVWQGRNILDKVT